ncbi:MAG: hypothetical protein DRR19_24885 [Candidatus Parabeggiatoa sp. nov. 1]|nr:MAG: hypothetical protein DRR19_24885 [Gammaproteobacteria bacterium]
MLRQENRLNKFIINQLGYLLKQRQPMLQGVTWIPVFTFITMHKCRNHFPIYPDIFSQDELGKKYAL